MSFHGTKTVHFVNFHFHQIFGCTFFGSVPAYVWTLLSADICCDVPNFFDRALDGVPLDRRAAVTEDGSSTPSRNRGGIRALDVEERGRRPTPLFL